MSGNSNSGLLLVWTSGDREVALKMVFMYAANARRRGWWDKITLLVWGPSQELLTYDRDLQDQLHTLLELEVRTIACKTCADTYSITEALEALGVEVFHTGQFLTEWTRSGGHTITV